MPKPYQTLLFRYEVLRAKLLMRDFFLKTLTRELYENIAQVLTHVHLQLSTLELEETKAHQSLSADNGRMLLKKAIGDLRELCRSFYPETFVLREKGWAKTVEVMVNSTRRATPLIIQSDSQSDALDPEMELLLLAWLHEIFTSMTTQQNRITRVQVKYPTNRINITLEAVCEVSGGREKKRKSRQESGFIPADLSKRVVSLGARLQLKRGRKGKSRIELGLPIKAPC